jgi:topoisomerase IV subunit B
MLRNYAYLNTGLTLIYNGKKFFQKMGLLDLLERKLTSDESFIQLFISKVRISKLHLPTAISMAKNTIQFVNGQHTSQGGTHQSAFREAVARTIREFYQ